MDSRSGGRVSLKHVLDELIKLGREVTGQFGVFTLDNSLSELMERLGIEGRLQGSHLVKEDSERPNIRLEVVALTLNNLRGEVIRGSDNSLSS